MTDQVTKLAELLKKADVNSALKGITDYEDALIDNAEYLIANSVSVPPCKVGTEVFYITNYSRRILSEKINKVSSHTIINSTTIYLFETDSLTFGLSDIGKTIFLTRESAEKELNGES